MAANSFFDGDVDADVLFNYFPPGYRFQPTDKELVDHYLVNKVLNLRLPVHKIKDTQDVYSLHPKDLTQAYPNYGGTVLHFFTKRKKRYRNGDRPNRTAGNGFWKSTGSGGERTINSNTDQEAKVTTLVFNIKKPGEKVVKTNWIMHEYELKGKDAKVEDYVLCKVYERIVNDSKTGSNENEPDDDDGSGTTSWKTRKRKLMEVASMNMCNTGNKTPYYLSANGANHLQGNSLLHQNTSHFDVVQSQYPLQQPYYCFKGDQYPPAMANMGFAVPITPNVPGVPSCTSTMQMQSMPSTSTMEYGNEHANTTEELAKTNDYLNYLNEFLFNDI